MKSASTFFLKITIILIGLSVSILCIFVLPAGITSDITGMFVPILVGMYIPAIPFFVGLFHAYKLLIYIDKKVAFSEISIKSLKIIKLCGVLISMAYALGLPYIFYVADKDDAPGVALIGLIFTISPALVSILAANLQRLLQNALNMKLENDLTV